MIARFCILIGLSLQVTVAFSSIPFATGDISRPECIDAMKLAETMYQSTAQRLYAPLTIPTDLQSMLVLGALAQDISVGDALTSTGVFENCSKANAVFIGPRRRMVRFESS